MQHETKNGSTMSSVIKWVLIFVALAGITYFGYGILIAPDDRNAVQKLGDAIEELPDSSTKAARELENRTLADKIGDAAQDASDDLKR